MTPDINTNRNKIRQFKCKNCGGELELQNKRSQYVACPYCGSVADSSSDAYKVLTKMGNPSNYPPMRFLKIGMEGVFNGKMYHVIGRTRRRNTYREYWIEDGESGYSNETWTFDEWLLISEDATYFTIAEDTEGFTIITPVTPKFPTLPEGEKMADLFSGKSRRVQEYGDTEILYYEGESTFLVQAGDKSSFSEYAGDSQTSYSAEWRYKDGEIKEIEFFAEQEISQYELKRAFNIEAEPQARNVSIPKPATGKKRNPRKTIILIGAALNILFLPFFLAIFANVKTTTSSENIDVETIANMEGWINVNDSSKAVIFSRILDINADTKRIDFEYEMFAALGNTCISKIVIIDNNNDTLINSNNFAYNYETTQKMAKRGTVVHKSFKTPPDIKFLKVEIVMTVNKKWNNEKQRTMAHFVKVTQADQVYTNNDIGSSNFILGWILLVIGILYPKKW